MENCYLTASATIDVDHPAIQAKAALLSANLLSREAIIGRCFEFVRDQIRHSSDAGDTVVTIRASDTLAEASGYCYAKSHLLAALLRACGIPAALCYQRLSLEGGGPPFCLHGLNAVQLDDGSWYRLDARGNKSGVNAAFCPPTERLAFSLACEGERDIIGRFAEPLPSVVDTMQRYETVQQLYNALPDWLPSQETL